MASDFKDLSLDQLDDQLIRLIRRDIARVKTVASVKRAGSVKKGA